MLRNIPAPKAAAKRRTHSSPAPMIALVHIRGGSAPAATKTSYKPRPHLHLDSPALEHLSEAPSQQLVEWRNRFRPHRRTHVHFVESRESVRTHEAQRGAQRGGRIGRVHQHEAPDDGVEVPIQLQVANVAGPERDVRRARHLGSAGRGTDHLGICIDSEDAARSADELSDEEGNVSRAAPDVEDSHARTNPRILEEVARQRFEELGTILQAPRFVGGPAHDVRMISASLLTHDPVRNRPTCPRPAGAAPDGSTHWPKTGNDVPASRFGV